MRESIDDGKSVKIVPGMEFNGEEEMEEGEKEVKRDIRGNDGGKDGV